MRLLKELTLLVVATIVISVFLFFLTLTSFGWGQWPLVAVNVVFFSMFILLIPFKRKMTHLPGSVYVAFVVALFAEMYGFPLTMYLFMGAFGYDKVYTLEFLLTGVMGQALFYRVFNSFVFPASKVIMGIGILLVIFGWKNIYKAKGQLVTSGIYRYIRHPQYLGFLLITLGLNVQWLTILTLSLYPVLAIVYYRLAKAEDKENEERFGEEFREYKRRVPGFIPRLRMRKAEKAG